MSDWKTHDFEQKIRKILKKGMKRNHHLEPAFLSSYQIAIEFKKNYPIIVNNLGYEIGGKGCNEKNSLAQYIGRELSRRIKNKKITDIDGGFISNTDLEEIIFKSDDGEIKSSLTGTNHELSIFRLRNNSHEK